MHNFNHSQLIMLNYSNILHLPFRRTHNVPLSEAIKTYISTKYDQHPDMFQHDLQVIDQLRHAAVQALEPHTSGVRKLQAYAAQLVWMGGKFPIDVCGQGYTAHVTDRTDADRSGRLDATSPGTHP